MRTLTPSSGTPRRDRGAVLVWVALCLVLLLGVGALVIDVGAIYVEKRQLQNGADAAALAVAQDCAGGDCGDAMSMAGTYADLNAKDGASAVDLLCGEGPGLTACADPAPSGAAGASGWVRVGTRTESSDGGDDISFVLAPIMGALTGGTYHQRAVAAWGPLGAALTLPFTLSECEFQNMISGDGEFPEGITTIYSKAKANSGPLVPGCEPRSSSGGYVEGGFGWLAIGSGIGCSVELDVGDTITGPSDPGNDNLMNKSPCNESMIQGKEVLLPLFNQVQGTGNNATYTISGFAGFVITGYQLSGSRWPTGFSCPAPPGSTGGTGNLRCFQGYFTRIVSGGDFGGGYDFGATAVKMAG